MHELGVAAEALEPRSTSRERERAAAGIVFRPSRPRFSPALAPKTSPHSAVNNFRSDDYSLIGAASAIGTPWGYWLGACRARGGAAAAAERHCPSHRQPNLTHTATQHNNKQTPLRLEVPPVAPVGLVWPLPLWLGRVCARDAALRRCAFVVLLCCAVLLRRGGSAAEAQRRRRKNPTASLTHTYTKLNNHYSAPHGHSAERAGGAQQRAAARQVSPTRFLLSLSF